MVRKSGKNWSHDLHKIGKYGKEIGEKSGNFSTKSGKIGTST